ncbi:MAG: acyltransferase family protein [Dehalococcoidia bacterium]
MRTFTDVPALGWRPSLDGLRGLAVVAVIAFHLDTVRYLPGGSLGVDVFFVLSGFLITSLLLEEWSRSGTISLRMFYIRRLLRLFPALVVFLLVYAVIVVAFNEAQFTGHQDLNLLLTNLGMAVAYLFNWVAATLHPRVWGLGHLWSLAVEEQFYLVGPALLVAALRFHLHPRVVIAASVALAAGSASLAFSGLSYTRLFFGTDFRVQELILGSILAQLIAARYLRAGMLQNFAFKALLTWSALSMVFLLLHLENRHTFLSIGGYTYVALISSVIVLEAALSSTGLLSRLLSQPWLIYVGRRSYALYLWHYPINIWLRGLDDMPQVILVVAFSVLLAELSFRFIERPALSLKQRLTANQSSGPISPFEHHPLIKAA